MKNRIAEASDSPRELESLYRASPREFRREFPDVFAERADSIVLRVWHERLFFDEPENAPAAATGWGLRDIGLTLALSLAAGTLAKLPHFFPRLNEGQFYSRNLGAIVAGTLLAYFCIQRACRTRLATLLATAVLGALLFLNALPGGSSSHTVVLSCMHMPFLFWSLLGIAFLGGAWRNRQGRMDYVRYNGELLIYTTLILIGGMVLTGLTFALFSLVNLRIEEWYIKSVVVYGAIAAPVVATFLIERVIGGRFRIAPLLAKVFTPLFLLTAVAYLLAMVINQKSPFKDRDFLIAFNGLLLVVLGLSVFSISERGPKATAGVADLMIIGLVSVTLAIDVIALAAILFRLTSYGFSPNRVAVLGANLLAFCHLAGILHHYVRFARERATFDAIENWIAGYLPAYTAWSVCVAFGFPLIFAFR